MLKKNELEEEFKRGFELGRNSVSAGGRPVKFTLDDNRKMLELLDLAGSKAAVARQFGCSRRYVYMLLGRIKSGELKID